MRRAGGVVVLQLGVLLVILGALGAIAFGPDNRVTPEPLPLSSLGIAVITAPAALAYSGPTVELTVTRDGSAPVFVGVGYDVDVQDYLTATPYTQVDSISIPLEVKTSEVDGAGLPEARPGDLDWWLVSDSGRGSATVTLPLSDAAVDVVVMDPYLRPVLDVSVTPGVVRRGAFVGGLALSLAGVALGVVGWMLISSVPTGRGRHTARQRLVRPDRAHPRGREG
jgi:hypothetical protein